MNTIGAKELRLHLEEVLDRVIQGEEIIVRHRFKAPVRLSAVLDGDITQKLEPLTGLQAFDGAPKHKSPYPRNKSVKELYNQSVKHKYVDWQYVSGR